MKKRVFLIVLDSLGIGEMPDANLFSDEGSNTLRAIRTSPAFHCPNLEALGLFHIDGVGDPRTTSPAACYARMTEASAGKDTTIGHWEIAGVVSKEPLPTYPHGFPQDVIDAFCEQIGRGVLCNKPYSGTQVIADYGLEHLQTGKPIVYTSADSVFQIAAHQDVIPLSELYAYCETARKLLSGKHGVGRVIARPFAGTHPFVRTSGRHDYSLAPPQATLPDVLLCRGYDSISVGKIYDIFAGRGFSEAYRTKNNQEGMAKTIQLAERDFEGLCFVNLVDFDMVYGHRNDVEGYAAAMTNFDKDLGRLLPLLCEHDLLIITADHGCDPSTPSTDHSREYTPMLMYGKNISRGVNLGTRETFADIAATILDYFDLTDHEIFGTSMLTDTEVSP